MTSCRADSPSIDGSWSTVYPNPQPDGTPITPCSSDSECDCQSTPSIRIWTNPEQQEETTDDDEQSVQNIRTCYWCCRDQDGYQYDSDRFVCWICDAVITQLSDRIAQEGTSDSVFWCYVCESWKLWRTQQWGSISSFDAVDRYCANCSPEENAGGNYLL